MVQFLLISNNMVVKTLLEYRVPGVFRDSLIRLVITDFTPAMNDDIDLGYNRGCFGFRRDVRPDVSTTTLVMASLSSKILIIRTIP